MIFELCTPALESDLCKSSSLLSITNDQNLIALSVVQNKKVDVKLKKVS